VAKLIRQLDQKIWLDRQIAEEFGGLQADALKNFKTTENKLSVFKVDEDNIQNTVIRILVALACGRQSPDKVDYALFDSDVLKRLDIQFDEIEGTTPDLTVNKLHIDLKKLSGDKICEFAKLIQNSGELERLLSKDLEKAMREGIEKEHLQVEGINPRLLQKIKPPKQNIIESEL
jgi:hypothetical protein